MKLTIEDMTSSNEQNQSEDSLQTSEESENLYAENSLELQELSFKEKLAYKKELHKKRLATMQGKEKRKYIISYYKWYFIAFILCICLSGWLIKTIYHSTFPQELNVAIANDINNDIPYDYIPEAFRDYYNLDNKNIIEIFGNLSICDLENADALEKNTSSNSQLDMYITSGVLDAVIADETALNYCTSNGGAAILDTCLEPELYEQIKDYIVTITDEDGYTNNGEPYAAAIDISGTDFVKNCNISYEKVYLFLPITCTENSERASRFIRLIFQL